MRRQGERQLVDLQPSPSLNDVYITDSKPCYGVSKPCYGVSTVRADNQEHTLQSGSFKNERRLNQDEMSPISEGSYRFASSVSSASTNEQRNTTDYYGKNYKMVKRSEFPGKPQSNSQGDADMVSISGSEISDYLLGPPRPSDSPSEDRDLRWEKKEEKRDNVQSYGNYSRGSYKEYSSRVQNKARGAGWSRRQELAEERTQQRENDRTRHLTSFQNTLKV